MRRTRFVTRALVSLAAVVMAACGSSDDMEGDTAGSAAAAGPVVNVAETSLGKVLVDSRGMTLYLFTKDGGGKSVCEGSCAGLWPPLTATGAPTAGEGVDGAKLTTITRSDGSTQLAFAGKPLYLYAKDAKPGDVNGQNVGGVWFAVRTDGTAATTASVDSPKGY